MLKVGDRVVHPVHGIGVIATLKEQQFSDNAPRLYYEVTSPRFTVWVPVEASQAGGLRPLTSKRDLTRYRKLLKSRPVALNEDYRQRQVELVERWRQGTFQSLCELVRDLQAQNQRKSLNASDSTVLHRSQELLYQEWAAIEGVSVPEAVQEIEDLLKNGQVGSRL